MFKIVKKQELNPTVTLMSIEAPLVAQWLRVHLPVKGPRFDL